MEAPYVGNRFKESGVSQRSRFMYTRKLSSTVFITALFCASAFAQVDYIVPDPGDATWNADTLYLGSSFRVSMPGPA